MTFESPIPALKLALANGWAGSIEIMRSTYVSKYILTLSREETEHQLVRFATMTNEEAMLSALTAAANEHVRSA
ncbi:MAG: hypothetical protein EON54_16680 [Alcaligenaceae bacterium]|nr:MAG: hypothetical protein EON54_16680 [Alcaligenaceae bacterium]